MRKRVLFMLLCVFAIGSWFSPLYASNDDTKEGLTDWAALIRDASQISSNYYFSWWSQAPANLLDGNYTTIYGTADCGAWQDEVRKSDITEETWFPFLTSWGVEAPEAGNTHIQVQLMNPVKEFKFKFMGQMNSDPFTCPNHIIVYGTNDETIAANKSNKNTADWVKLAEYDETNFPQGYWHSNPFNGKPWESEVITTEEEYSFLRFVVANTFANSVGSLSHANPELTGVLWELSEFQVYAKEEITGSVYLENLIDSIDNQACMAEAIEKGQLISGDKPGELKAGYLEKYQEAHKAAELSLFETKTDEEYIQFANDLRKAYYELLTPGVGTNPLESGYYFIDCAYPGFKDVQGVTKSWRIENGKNNVVYYTTNRDDVNQLWYVNKMEDGTYSFKNVVTKKYVGWMEHYNWSVHLNNENDPKGYEATPDVLASGQWDFRDPITHMSLAIGWYDEGKVDSYDLIGYNPNFKPINNTFNICRFYAVPATQEQVDAAFADEHRAQMAKIVESAAPVMQDAIDSYNDLVTDPNQFSANARNENTIFKNLLDGDVNTEFETICTGDFYWNPDKPEIQYGWHHLQFRLNEPAQNIRIFMEGRYGADGVGENRFFDHPDDIDIYATNDDALGKSDKSSESAKWDFIVNYKADKDPVMANKPYARVTYPNVDLGKKYKYIRMEVKHTSSNYAWGWRPMTGWYGAPEKTGVLFGLSEMRITETEPNGNSQYDKTPGVKEAYDALKVMIDKANKDIIDGNPTAEEMKAMKDAILNLDTMLVDRSGIYNKMQDIIRIAKNSINKVKAETPLITNPKQMSSNSWLGGTMADMLDGNVETSYHTMYDGMMQDSTANELMWMERLESMGYTPDPGYHNLQVTMMKPVKDFRFEYIGRGSSIQDNPNHIAIYATNDDELGSSPNNDYVDMWTPITELTPENGHFPEYEEGHYSRVPYVSDEIVMSEPYKYIRFVVKGTTTMNKKSWRVCVLPEVTGVCWNLSEFQMYSKSQQSTPQYEYIPEVKEATDALEALYNKYSAYQANDFINDAPYAEMEKAILALQAVTVDTTEVGRLYDKYMEVANNSVLSGTAGYPGGIGEVDEAASIENFSTAVKGAHAAIEDAENITKAQIVEAEEKLHTAYAEFLKHVKMFEPYKWYNILTASTSESFIDAPVFLSGLDLGSNLNVGLSENDPAGDVYAIWRIVPIEGKEGQYAIQSLGTGQYFGPYRGNGSGAQPVMSHSKAPYVIEYCGNAAFNIRQANVLDKNNNIKLDNSGIILNWPSNNESSQEWRFSSVAETGLGEVAINWYRQNNIDIVAFPWAVKAGEGSLTDLCRNNGEGEQVKTYAINSIVSNEDVEGGQTVLTLTEKTEFEAGEPMVLETIGNAETNPSHPLSFNIPSETPEAITDTSAVVVNGLVGKLQGDYIKCTQATLWFSAAQLTFLPDGENQWIDARNGYIDASKSVDLQGKIDKTITIGGMINGVENIEIADAKEIVNVYTIDGVMVKQNVKATEATKNLAKGIYIVGKKKVLVK